MALIERIRCTASPLALAALMAWPLGGCADPVDSPLANARQSPEALAAAALDAIEAADEDRLAALMITRDEYEQLLWPALPDRHQMPFAFAWSVTAPQSRKARRRAINEYRGVPLEVVGVTLGDDVEPYDAFTLYRDARIRVRRTDTGAEGLLPLMDTVVEMGGGWKFMNFVDDV